MADNLAHCATARPCARPAWLIALAATVAVSGCGDKVCTLIGPLTGLTLSFSPSPAGPLRVEVFTGQFASFVYDCTDIARCARAVNIPDYYPASALAKITYQGRTRTVPISPQYIESEVNGPGCGASRSAMVTIALP